MSFFSLLETLFFISLAITFILIMMLVYHFKGRLVMLEDKCNTMFEIMNSMVKEMKNIKDSVAAQAAMLAAGASVGASVGAASAASIPQESPVRPPGMAFGNGLFPPELLQIFGSRPNSLFNPSRFSREDDDEYDNDVEDEEDDEDDDENNGFKKIVVSDTELDDEDDEDNDVKVISVDISEPTESEPLADLEEENLNDIDIDIDESEVDVETEIEAERNEPSPSIEIEIGSKEIPDYKKMDVSYLRTMVITRGLATDTKKMKKQDLIRLLEQA
jgi:hypothetical protein